MARNAELPTLDVRLLQKALEADDVETVRGLLDRGLDVDAPQLPAGQA